MRDTGAQIGVLGMGSTGSMTMWQASKRSSWH
jgi:hypothetical protein